ncbi:MAG TPA: hypothetical protein VIO94_04855 [Phenylobacterium sp.]
MRTAAILIAAAALTGWAGAASARVSDVDYIQANRCAALAEGGSSADAFKTYVKSEGRGRHATIQRMATDAASKARRQSRSDSAERKASLDAELGGVCQAFIGGDQTTGTAAKSDASPAS